jgi:trk system potassium uptake protein
MRISKYKAREFFFKKLFLIRDIIKRLIISVRSGALFVFTLSSILFLFLFLFDLGFRNSTTDVSVILKAYLLILSGLFWSKCIFELTHLMLKKWISLAINLSMLFFVFLILLIHYHHFYLFGNWENTVLSSKNTVIACAFILIISEIHRLSDYFNRINISPRLLFAGSFLLIILLGSGLLMTPNATYGSISYLEALFTATSAVCVTGLVVLDTATVFTPVGKSILLFLIQIGGLGIMAFTGFFSYIFMGSATLRERFILKDLFSGEQLGGMFRLIFKIIAATFLLEFLGALVLYFSIHEYSANKMAYAVFHAVSAFCNAGFTIFPDELASQVLHQNYILQMTLAVLIIFGGLGFPVLLTFYTTLKNWSKSKLGKLVGAKRESRVIPFLVGQKLAFWTSIVLLLTGMLLYYWFEKNNSLVHAGLAESLVVSFFGSVSARTAGFNIVNISVLTYPTVFIMIVLMWIGASPGSTGGGIKTTTLALALRATYSYCRGRRYLEIGNREIGLPTLSKVLATIVISLLIIFIAFILLLTFDPTRNPIHLLFECFSAFSTVGLSMAGTSSLSSNSKIVLILLMYIGRISPLILLSGLLFSKMRKKYRLPVENIAIN